MRLLPLAVMASALVAAAPLAAEDWRVAAVFGEEPDLRAGMIDADGIDLTDPAKPFIRTGVLRYTPMSDGIVLIVSWQEVDCAANTSRLAYLQGFDINGDMMFQEELPDEAKAIGEHTTLHLYRRAACEKEWWPGARSTGGKPLAELSTEIFAR